jgi:putative DNA primase/helicase
MANFTVSAAPVRVGDKSAWYIFHGDHGAFGSFRLDVKQGWESGDERLSKEERRQLKEKVNAAYAAAHAETARLHAAATRIAKEQWNRTAEIIDRTDHHSYLVTKQIDVHRIRRDGMALVVPMHDIESGELVNLQRIHPITGKRFLPDGQVLGTYLPIAGAPVNGKQHMIIAEGYATGVSIFEATRLPVAVVEKLRATLASLRHARQHARLAEQW